MNARVDDYIDDFFGWPGETAAMLRREILAAGEITEDFRWGTPIFEGGGGPVCLIKVNVSHVTLGFWRGQQMSDLDARLAASGTYRMADIKLTGPDEIDPVDVRRLVAAGIALNQRHGSPLAEARP